MRWEVNLCPECGAPVYGVLQQVAALVDQDEETGAYDWTGDTELDSQAPLYDEQSREGLTCDVGHVWWSKPVPEVQCKLCHRFVLAATAHAHQGKWIGEECQCWDERLRPSE